MYVIQTYFASTHSRVISGALVVRFETLPNCHFITRLNKYVLISIFERLLFLANETCITTGKSFHTTGSAMVNDEEEGNDCVVGKKSVQISVKS